MNSTDYRQQEEMQEEAEQRLRDVYAKIAFAKVLTEDELALLRWALNVAIN